MKRLYSLLLFCMLVVFASYGQCSLVLAVDDSANQEQDSVKIRGSFNGWMNVVANDDGMNGDALAGDNIWSATVMADPDGSYEWGAEGNDGTWLIEGPNVVFTTDGACNIGGDTVYVIEADMPVIDLVLTVTDETEEIDSIQFKGSFNGWSNVRGNDAGVDGDAVAGDNIWSASIQAEIDGSYEWGAERLDCPNGPAWIIGGPNRVFEVDSAGNVSGETNYTLSATSNPVDVTFRVDMSDEIVSSEGLYVGGAFEVCPWTKNDIELMEVGNSGVYQTTVTIGAGQTYEYKYYNGTGGDPDGEANDSPIFADQGCGVANPFGGANRVLDLTNATGDTLLPIFIYNSCDLSTSVKDLNVLPAFEINPNPASHQTTIIFDNTNGDSYNLTVSDITGQIVDRIEDLNTNQVVYQTGNLSKGIYLATLRNQKGEFVTQKLVIQ